MSGGPDPDIASPEFADPEPKTSVSVSPTFIVFTAILMLLLSGIGIVAYSERAYQARKLEEMAVRARILASMMSAALAFDDSRAARDYVGAMSADPEIRTIGVYDATGALFAASPRMPVPPPPVLPLPAPASFSTGKLATTEPVTRDGTYLGAVYIRSATEPLSRRLERYGLIALLVTMASVAAAILGGAHKALVRANRALAEQARNLARANRDLHLQIEHREKVEEALRQAQKMEAIGQLTGGVAHDFNNLLTSILGNADLLERKLKGEGIEDGKNIAPMVNSIIAAAERAAALTQRLLAFSRKQTLLPKTTDVNRLVAGMHELIRGTLGASVTIETHLTTDLWMTFIDAHQLENALLNLAVNARDAMSAVSDDQGTDDPGADRTPSRTLTIETANICIDEDEASSVEAPPGQYVMVSVRDNGVGMPPDILRRVFDPFFTTKGPAKGTGLGLSQVYGFVKQSLGYITIESRPGSGTTVRLHLPRWRGAAERREPQGGEAELHGDGETVLVVEDRAEVRGYTASAASLLGYRVLEAVDAESALRVLEQHPETAMLLTDIGLPGRNGRQLAEEALRRVPALKVLYTSGYFENADLPEADIRFLPKPFTIEQLARKLRESL